ncbi:ABC transporter substrate-binding protein [Candidatus Curtissbacteria bacterium]|nr:ABC transporter substrate-binding protein [Candidatus Curtissbacteria bacterium]
MTRNLPIFIILASLFLGGAYFLLSPKLGKLPTYNGPVQQIRLGVSKSAPQLSTLIYMAESKGYFKENKLDVIIDIEPDSTASRKDVSSGKEDLATTSDFGFVGDSFLPNDLRILAAISNTKLIEIVGRRDRGIVKPADLKGKKVALTQKSYSEFFFGEFLTLNGLNPSDVTFVAKNLDKVQEAIVGGEVDAAVTNDPFAYDIRKALGENVVDLPTPLGRNNNLLLITNVQAIQSKPVEIEKFLAALIRAQEFVITNPEDAKRTLVEKFKLDPTYFKQTWPKNTFTVTLDQSLILQMEDEAVFSIKNGLTQEKKVPSYLDFIYSDALQKVRPEAVNILR